MWPRRSRALASLTKSISIKNKSKFENVEQDYFEGIKRILSRNTLLTYPDFNETFKIHTDASTFQLGAVISQKGKPIAFYSREITGYQKRCTVTERKILIIVETLGEFRTTLLGKNLIIYNDH